MGSGTPFNVRASAMTQYTTVYHQKQRIPAGRPLDMAYDFHLRLNQKFPLWRHRRHVRSPSLVESEQSEVNDVSLEDQRRTDDLPPPKAIIITQPHRREYVVFAVLSFLQK